MTFLCEAYSGVRSQPLLLQESPNIHCSNCHMSKLLHHCRQLTEYRFHTLLQTLNRQHTRSVFKL